MNVKAQRRVLGAVRIAESDHIPVHPDNLSQAENQEVQAVNPDAVATFHGVPIQAADVPGVSGRRLPGIYDRDAAADEVPD